MRAKTIIAAILAVFLVSGAVWLKIRNRKNKLRYGFYGLGRF